METPEKFLEDNGYIIDELQELGTILFRNPDYAPAIIGMSSDHRVIYDYDKMLYCLIDNEDMSYEEAADFISCDTIKALNYICENSPIIMYPLID